MIEQADAESRPLYIRFYFDEDIANDIVENLRQRGFDVLCARDTHQLSLSDKAQLAFAVDERRAIVTHNRHDFEQLHQYYLEKGIRHWGILIAKRRRNSTIIVHKLLTLLDTVTAEELCQQLRYL